MLKELKEKVLKTLIEFLKESLGEKYEVNVAWGIPIVTITIIFKSEIEETKWVFNFNQETEDYEVETRAMLLVDGKETPGVARIDRNTINFILGHTLRISNEILKPSVERAPAPDQEAK